MNAYLFSAGCTTTQITPTLSRGGMTVNQPQTWDGCTSAIIYGGDAEQAQKRFEDWLTDAPDAEQQSRTEIKRLVAAQFVDQLLTETGNEPLDWLQLTQQMIDVAEDTAADNFEQGYWVDINQTLPPGKISSDIESLQRDLPEDVRSGLNWSPDQKFFFLLSVLSPLSIPGNLADPAQAAPDADPADETEADEKAPLEVGVVSLPEMRDKEAAALVQARNSVVAAWLWRKYASDTRLALHEIHVSPPCGLVPIE